MLTAIRIKDFRGHSGVFQLSPGRNVIRGANESGKTTLIEAVMFAFLGTDSDRSGSIDHLISNGADSTEVEIRTAKASLTRKKRRGGQHQVRLTIGDGQPIELSQTELQEKMLRLDPDVFASCLFAGFFMRLPSDERMRVFAAVAKSDRRALLRQQLPVGTEVPAKLKLEDVDVDIKVLEQDRRQLQNIVAADEGQLREIVARREELGRQGEAVIDREAVIAAGSRLSAELELMRVYRHNLAKYEAAAQQFRRDQEMSAAAESEVQKWRQHISTTQSLRQGAADPVLREPGISRLSELIAKHQETYLAIPSAPVKPKGNEGVCSECGQSVGKDHLHQVMAAYEQQLLAYNQEARRVEDHNQSVRAQVAELSRQLESERSSHQAERQRIYSLDQELKNSEQMLRSAEAMWARLKGIPEPRPPQAPEVDWQLTEIEAKESELVEMRAQLKSADQAAAAGAELESRSQQLQGSIATKKAQIATWSAIEKALKALPAIEAESLGKALSLESGRFVVKRTTTKRGTGTAEKAELLLTDKQGVDYRTLSSGRRKKLDIEVALKLQELAGPASPRFLAIDDQDLMDSPVAVPGNVQILEMHVGAVGEALSVTPG